jgi:hypothetical protein
MAPTEKKLLSISDLVTLYGVGRSTLFAELRAGRLKSSYIFGRRYIRPSDAEEWLDARLREGATARRGGAPDHSLDRRSEAGT